MDQVHYICSEPGTWYMVRNMVHGMVHNNIEYAKSLCKSNVLRL